MYSWNYVEQTPAEQFVNKMIDNVKQLRNQGERIRDVSSNKKKSNTANIQQQLYKLGYFGDIDFNKAVDGIWGKKTEVAYQKALADGYENNNYKLVKSKKSKKSKKSVNRSYPYNQGPDPKNYNIQPLSEFISDIPNEIKTNPVTLWLQDIITHPFRKVNKNYKAKVYTEKDFPQRKLKLMDEIVKNKVDYNNLNPGDTVYTSFSGYDYSPHYSDPLSADTGTLVFDNKSSLGVSLGGASVKAYNGGYEITDKYDFMEKYPKGFSLYALARTLSSLFGSLEKENIPKYTFKIKR